MKAVNLPAASQRNSEVGLVWEEKLVNAAGTFEAPYYATVRISATAVCNVTLDGESSITLQAGEVERINVGVGAGSDDKKTVKVVTSGAAYVSVAKSEEKKRRRFP